MNKLILHTILFVFVASIAQAQIPLDGENKLFLQNLNEEVKLFNDRDLYLSGEDIWFTAFVLINNLFGKKELSKIVYIELFDGKKKPIFKGKFEINNGMVSGSFQIPPETRSGNYFVRAYTLFQRNSPPENIQTKRIRVINTEFSLPKDEIVNPIAESDSMVFDVSKMDTEGNVQIEINTDKTVYGNRDPIALNIKMPDAYDGTMTGLCVSVVRKGALQQSTRIISSVNNRDHKNQNNQQEIFWIPETRGVGLSGFVSDKNTLKPIEGLKVYLSVLGQNPQLHMVQTKENGAFIFVLGNITETKELFLGVDPNDQSNVQISVNNNFSNDFGHLSNVPLSIDSSFKNLLEEMMVNHQTQLIFSPHKASISELSVSSSEVFSHPEISIHLADYIDLPNLEAIFYELVPTVKVRGKVGQKKISVFDPKTEIIFPNQLLLVDHVPVFDCEATLGLPPSRIDNIEVVNSTYYLGDNTFRNVVMINSKAHDFAGYNFPDGSIFVDYQNLSPIKKFSIPDYQNQSDKNSRIPDFRTLLYWNPEIEISKTDTTLQFYTSDNTGVYDIFVRGFTKNGKLCFGQGSIKIQ